MNKDILFKVLQLDSIYQLLDWTERAFIHQYSLNRLDKITPKIFTIYQWIIESNWTAPEMKYMDDRLSYYKSKKEMKPLENYPLEFTEITKSLQQIKL